MISIFCSIGWFNAKSPAAFEPEKIQQASVVAAYIQNFFPP